MESSVQAGLLAGTTQPLLHVDRVEKRRDRDLEDAFTIEYYRYTLTDGSRYDVDRFSPNNPKFNSKATYDTPWCTDLDGFNARIGAGLALEGVPTIGVSPERLRARTLAQRLGGLSLLHDAQAHHAILNYLDERELGPHGPRQAVSVGYSRGAMLGFGLNALSMIHRRDIQYSDYLDPCLEHRVRLRDIDWLDVPEYVGKELLALGKGLTGYTPNEILNLSKGALKPSVCFWLQQAALAKTLFSGEAGSFVDGWHPDSVARITLYTASRFNHANEWAQHFARLQNVDTITERGLHLSGVEPRVLRNTIARVVLAENAIRDDCSPTEIHAQMMQWRPPELKKKMIHLPHLPKLRAA